MTATALLALLPVRFNFSLLQTAFEAVVGTASDKRNFRRSMMASGAIRETGEFEFGSHRPARLFEADRAAKLA